jgi:hypothetical protein
MMRVSFITLFVTAVFATNAAAQDSMKLAALSPGSMALLAERPAGPETVFEQGAGQARRDSRLNGFLIGLAAGAVPGIWLGMGMRSWCVNESGDNCSVWVPIVGVPLALAGGGIGFAIDGAIGQSMNVGRPRANPGVRFSIRF